MESIILPLVGGILIGVSSSVMLFGLGRITGISGIFASSFLAKSTKTDIWRHLFILGLIIGGVTTKLIRPELFNYEFPSSIPLVVTAGILVGFGTRLGGGCTSGHGVCGLPRKSARSFVATIIFMGFGILTVAIKGALS